MNFNLAELTRQQVTGFSPGMQLSCSQRCSHVDFVVLEVLDGITAKLVLSHLHSTHHHITSHQPHLQTRLSERYVSYLCNHGSTCPQAGSHDTLVGPFAPKPCLELRAQHRLSCPRQRWDVAGERKKKEREVKREWERERGREGGMMLTEC